MEERRFSVSEGTWWSHARYPERETPKNFNIPETETGSIPKFV